MISNRSFNVSVNGNEYSIEIRKIEEGQATVEVNGMPFEVTFESSRKASKTPTLLRQPAYTTETERPMKTAAPAASKNRFVKAPLPGVILNILVKEGDTVKAGQIVLLMEAMKMENNIVAPADGTILQMKVTQGANVLEGDPLFELGGSQNA
ncbi:MAG: biotin/lipoyl-containing protein [Bacteroidota bacterium]|jgi:biotin carboxyl carrier protein